MSLNKKVDVFLSYSHKDEDFVEDFKKHTSQLITEGLIDIWYDRNNSIGSIFQANIDDKLLKARIVCLFLSANFLSSEACRDELATAIKTHEKYGATVVPIILSPCGWLDEQRLSKFLATPTDGKSIEEFENKNLAWKEIYQKLRIIIEQESLTANLSLTDHFMGFLNSAELISNAHPTKLDITLEDVFVHPELEKYDDLKEYEKNISSLELINNFSNYSKILLAGENQSGKTTVCKMLFKHLRENNFIPIYVKDQQNEYSGLIKNRIDIAFQEQYENADLSTINQSLIIPILDDFHLAKRKEIIINQLDHYDYSIIVVDDIFSINIADNTHTESFFHFKIKECSPILRGELIKNWTELSNGNSEQQPNQNQRYKNIDSTTENVNVALGKIMGSGIMPAYPFFILSIISASESMGSTIEKEITSQGHCYQALIYLYLRKAGVKTEEVDTYLNFLTELAYSIYTDKIRSITDGTFSKFMEEYAKKYNMPIEKETLLTKLIKTNIIYLDGYGNYCFKYLYLYYYFVAKYLTEHINESKEIINEIISGLDNDENAYIAIFISHHTKDSYILDEITINALELFDAYQPATLSKQELQFFDIQVERVVNEVMPLKNVSAEEERTRRLKKQGEIEAIKSEKDYEEDEVGGADDLLMQIRKSIKTVDVMGCIIKNRAGSLEKSRLDNIFEEAMNIHFRFLSYFFDIIKKEEDYVLEFIATRIDKFTDDKNNLRAKEGKKSTKLSEEDIKELSKTLFWNINFHTIRHIIGKIVHGVGSNKLTDVVERVCDKDNSPASFMVKHGILMWYNKNIEVKEIIDELKSPDFSHTAKKIMTHLIIDHCAMHQLKYSEKQKIEAAFSIPTNKLKKLTSSKHIN